VQTPAEARQTLGLKKPS